MAAFFYLKYSKTKYHCDILLQFKWSIINLFTQLLIIVLIIIICWKFLLLNIFVESDTFSGFFDE